MDNVSSTRQPISVSFCVSDNYVQHLAVVALSILDHASEGQRFVFHVLVRAISEDSRRRLSEIERAWPNCRFAIHVVDSSLFDTLPLTLDHVTQETYYRFLLPQLLTDEARTIYMDVDVLVFGDLAPFWETDLGDAILGGVLDVEKPCAALERHRQGLGLPPNAPYVNAGILLMDLDGLRRFHFTEKCFAATAELGPRIAFVDQDPINVVAHGHLCLLPKRWNFQDKRLHGERPVIRHFASFTNKPWCNIWKNCTWPLYLRYLCKSPYRDRAARFLWGHILGIFWFRYVKKGIERTLFCGILIHKRPAPPRKGT